jgi:hypothetical protein
VTSTDYPFRSSTFTLEIPVNVPVITVPKESANKKKNTMTRFTMDGQLPNILSPSDRLLFREQPTDIQRYLYVPQGELDSRTPT